MTTFHYSVAAIPLNRQPVVDFLLPPTPAPRGTAVQILDQRPTAQAEAEWVTRLQELDAPGVVDLLALDSPHTHLIPTTTDRLVPSLFLSDPDFLTRSLGGWSPIYFATMGLPQPLPADPLLDHLEELVVYGEQIDYFGADPAQVAARLDEELEGLDAAATAEAYMRLFNGRSSRPPVDHIEQIYREIVQETYFVDDGRPPLPRLLLLDELMGQLVRLELERRKALANGDTATVESIAAWQQARREESGLHLILKGEYIAGRHRRSTILIAPELGVVVKQPAPEPFHEIEIAARHYDGRSENWPTLTRDKKLVTPRGRLRLILEEGFIPRLHDVFDHKMSCSSLLGLTVEQFVVGPTVQEYVLADPARMTASLYDTILLHQQVCEALGVENGDWHAANFILRDSDGEIVHIDWGAARPLRQEELSENGRLARLNQVKNIAFSFHDDALARRVLTLHDDLLAHPDRPARLRRRAEGRVM
jgi:hypothetical protein